jgi:hypothetical protein
VAAVIAAEVAPEVVTEIPSEFAVAEVPSVLRRSIASPQLPGVVASVAGGRRGETRDRQGEERPGSKEPH